MVVWGKHGVYPEPLFVDPLYSSSTFTCVTPIFYGWSVSPVNTAAGACFSNLYRAEGGKLWLQSLPDPASNILASGVFQPGYVVEIVMIQLIVERLEGALYLAKVHDPATGFCSLAADRQADMEGVAMQALTFVSLRYVR